MRWVQRVVGRDGSERLYLRKKGLPSVRLTQAFGSAELEAEVLQLVGALEPDRAPPGSLKEAVRRYRNESADFLSLAASTQYEYGLILTEFETSPRLSALTIPQFTPALVRRLRDAWAPRGHRAANVRLQVLKNVLEPSLADGHLEIDPFTRLRGVRRPHDAEEPHLLWPADAVRTVIEAAILAEKFGLARAVALGRFAGARRADLVKMPRAALQDGRLRFLSGKRRIPVDVPADPDLVAWMQAIPARQPDRGRQGRKLAKVVRTLPPATLVFNLANERYTEDGLGLELGKLVQGLHAGERLDSLRYDLHGLRHTRGVELALAGCTDAQGAAQLGHGSPSSFAQYRRQADRIRMADDAASLVERLRERSRNAEVKNEVENSCKTEAVAAAARSREL